MTELANENLRSFVEIDPKSLAWEEALRRIERTVDKLGHPVDLGIKETVVGLNLCGINTSGSCEGHEDHGTFAPYIDVHAAGVSELSEKWRQLSDEAEQNETLLEITRMNLEERETLLLLQYQEEMAVFTEFLKETFFTRTTDASE